MNLNLNFMLIEEKVLFDATVSLPIMEDKVLLAIKTRKIGALRWNGFGGGVDEGESILASAIRELEEESGKKVGKKYITTKPENLEKVAIAYFHNEQSDGSSFVCCVHFFLVKEWEGESVDTDEMINSTLFNINDLPLDEMMPADKKFFPLIMNGKKVIVKAHYTPFQKELIGEVEIEEVENFED